MADDRPPLPIRADGDSRIGLGHLMRSLAIAESWRDAGGGAWWLGEVPEGAISRRIEASGIQHQPGAADPGSPADMNFSVAAPFRGKRLGTPVLRLTAGPARDKLGLERVSDHTLGLSVAVAAVSLGANVVEKHLTLSRAEGGADAAFSLEPDEFRSMATSVREAQSALGGVRYDPTSGEGDTRRLRSSLFVVADMRAGERLTAENVRSIRPGAGLHPRHMEEILGKTTRWEISRGTPLRWEMIET